MIPKNIRMGRLLIVVMILMSCSMTRQADDNKFNSARVDEVLSNKRLLDAYIKCVLEKGACTAEGRELKMHITNALQTGCAKCTDVHRKTMQKVIKHLIQYNNKQWLKLVDKYDADRKYSAKYEKEMKNLLNN